MAKTKKSVTAGIIIICLLLCASIALSSITLYGQVQTTKLINQNYGNTEDVEQEDDVTIAGQYTIKSTLQISDAYKSGDTSELSDLDKETLDMAKDVIKAVIKENMTPYEKEKAIYEWLVKDLTTSTGILTVVPAVEQDNDNPHDVLKYKSAVCVGYATTFRMFMQMLDVECMVIHNKDLYHSWNLVKLDGDWYHVDCYSDSDSSTYLNFNMNDTQSSYNHDWTREYFPKAKGTKYNYILSVCEEINSYKDIPEWVYKSIEKKKTVFSCTFKKPITEKNQYAAKYLTEYLDTVGNSSDKYYFNYQWTQNDEGEYVLCYNVTYYGEDLKIDEKTQEKINEIVDKATNKYVYGLEEY